MQWERGRGAPGSGAGSRAGARRGQGRAGGAVAGDVAPGDPPGPQSGAARSPFGRGACPAASRCAPAASEAVA
ncbi:hypothetical protein ADL00_42645 [Streptomyces sp. AS58]|nr:hypothetical protein ADL00_42645 [Streptomyces sp. AS58]